MTGSWWGGGGVGIQRGGGGEEVGGGRGLTAGNPVDPRVAAGSVGPVNLFLTGLGPKEIKEQL